MYYCSLFSFLGFHLVGVSGAVFGGRPPNVYEVIDVCVHGTDVESTGQVQRTVNLPRSTKRALKIQSRVLL